MRFYWHLSEDERDQIGILRAAGHSIGVIARANLGLVEGAERTQAAHHRMRDDLRIHLPSGPESRDALALFDASPQTSAPPSRQTLTRHDQGSRFNPR